MVVRLLVAVAAASLAGCSASRKVAEQSSVDLAQEMSVTNSIDELTATAVAVAENLVIEKPEIVVTDTAGRLTVTIRGERLKHESKSVGTTESRSHATADSASKAVVEAGARRDIAGCVRSFNPAGALLAAAVAAAILWLLKKMGQ